MDVEWLSSPEGREAITTVAGIDPLRARAVLPHLSPQQVADALTQARHRPPGFPLALVTVDGIQQASPVPVAARRAQRLAQSGIREVVDAGCGIGLDAWAFAHAGLTVRAYDLDARTVEVARANLAGLAVTVEQADITTIGVHAVGDTAVYVDPARRRGHQDVQGRPVRVRDPEQWRPPWSWVRTHASVARLAPGFRDVPEGSEWHCSSIGRSLVDATLWAAPLARTDRRASVLHDGTWHELAGPAPPAHTGPVSDFLLDPDPAIVRTGLVTAAAQSCRGHLIDEHLAFVTSATAPPPWLGRAMQVLDEVPLKAVSAACRAAGLARVTVWSRGFDRPPDVRLPHGTDGIVVAARIGPARVSRAWIGVPVHPASGAN